VLFRRAVDLRAVDFLRPPVALRAVLFLRAGALRAVDLRAVVFRAVDLRAVDLRAPVDLRAVLLRPVVFFAAKLSTSIPNSATRSHDLVETPNNIEHARHKRAFTRY